MSEFDRVLEGLEDTTHALADEPGSPAERADANPELQQMREKLRALEQSSATDRVRAEQAALQAAQAAHHAQQLQQQQLWQQQQQAPGYDGFELDAEFNAEQFLEDPERAARELEVMGTRLQEQANYQVDNRVAPMEQAFQAGAQELMAISQTLHTQAVESARKEYESRGWEGFEEDLTGLRSKFYNAGHLPDLEAIKDPKRLHQLMMLERDGSGRPLATTEPKSQPMPSLGVGVSIRPETAKGRLTGEQASFLRSWDVDPSDVDLNKKEFSHLQRELGGAGR